MPTLAEFQRRFAAALLDPRESLGDEHEAAVKVHRNTVIKGLLDVLAANYPTVERLVGADWFRVAAGVYAREHLPSVAALALYGESFPNFLAGSAPATEFPYVAEVARIDRMWTEAHFAADAPALRATDLRALAADELQNLRLPLHPAARFGWFQHSAVTVWSCNRPPTVPPPGLEIDGSDEGALLVRPFGAVELLPLNDGEHSFLVDIAAGATLGAAAVSVLEHHATADVAAMLARFLNAGAFGKSLGELDD